MATLRAVAKSAVSITAGFAAGDRAGHLSEPAAQQAALIALRTLRYEGEEYVWVQDMRPVMLMHPFKPALEGTNLAAMTDPNGEHLFVDFVETVTRQKFGHGGLFVAPSGIGGAGGQIVEGAEPLIVSSVSRLRPDAMVERLDHYVARDLHPALR